MEKRKNRCTIKTKYQKEKRIFTSKSSLVLFFACSLNSQAVEPIFVFESIYVDPDADIIWYNDMAIVPEGSLENPPFYCFPILVPGETYLLKVTYGNSLPYTVDSCFTTFTYIPEGYEAGGVWVYPDTGTLAHPSGFYGFYNAKENLDFDPEDYSDYTEEELEAEYALSRLHFIFNTTAFNYIKIEIYETSN